MIDSTYILIIIGAVLCMAASAGAVTTVGTKPPAREIVDMLKERVIIEKMKDN